LKVISTKLSSEPISKIKQAHTFYKKLPYCRERSRNVVPDCKTFPLVFERDDGFFQIGLGDDAPGPFETRHFAQAVAARTAPVLA
jgi:hypothetical protein